jgi:hypothetical protein
MHLSFGLHATTTRDHRRGPRWRRDNKQISTPINKRDGVNKKLVPTPEPESLANESLRLQYVSAGFSIRPV